MLLIRRILINAFKRLVLFSQRVMKFMKMQSFIFFNLKLVFFNLTTQYCVLLIGTAENALRLDLTMKEQEDNNDQL